MTERETPMRLVILILIISLVLATDTPVRAQDGGKARSLRPDNVASWAARIQADYPVQALQAGEEGAVQMQLLVDEEGGVKNCEVKKSSGSLTLDHAACLGMVTHARYLPALDEDGNRIETHTILSIRYVLPNHSGSIAHPVAVDSNAWRLAAFDETYNQALLEKIRFQLVIDESGKPAGCGILISSGNAELDRTGCASLLRHAKFKPATTPDRSTIPGAYWVSHKPVKEKTVLADPKGPQ